ncbi:DUF3772 domain-containing protein [Rhodobacteraceae bacterium D3-12]|nr:DUF3772 domain-containing protein [Rhodobacteraceae bacterium D3-12]
MMRLRAAFHAVLLVVLLIGGAAFAQGSASGLDYDAWGQTATRAEAAIEASRASDTAMQALRAELVKWRTQFVKEQSVNARTIVSVEAQLAALGPAPESGTEAEEVAAERQRLNTRLVELKAPGRVAEVALSRVNVLIAEIDDILSDRQSDALIERGPSPLNPALWQEGGTAVYQSLADAWGEIRTAWDNPTQRATFTKKLPVVLVLTVLGMLIVVFARGMIQRLNQKLNRGRLTPARWLMSFVLSLGQIALPMIGLIALVGAAYATDFVGLRVDPLLNGIVGAGLVVLVAMWIGVRIFPKGESERNPLVLPPEKMREGRLVTGLIGLVLALDEMLHSVSIYDNWSGEVRGVVFFPLILLGSGLLWRIGVLLRRHGDAALAETESEDSAHYAERLYRLVGRLLAVVAFVPPVLAMLGYMAGAERLLFPMLESLLLLAVVLIVQRVLAELYVLVRRREDVRDGLIPVLTGMVLIVIATPLFALIWGMSENQLIELWRSAGQGITVGDVNLSPGVFVMFAVVFTIGYTLTRLLQGTLKNTVLPKTKMDMGTRNAFVSGIGYIGIFLAAMVAITSAGIDLTALGYVAGALSVGIGFGLQNIVSNFVSGIILLIERPISEGDWIEVGGTHGTVRDISVRSTRIETFDRTDVIVPNADLITGTVTNYTRGNTIGRVIVPVGVSYDYVSETKRIEQILSEIAAKHPVVMHFPAPYVVFQGFGADSLDFEIRAILRDVNKVLSVRSDMNHEIARRFAEEGIEIPFAQRDIWIRNPEALAGGAKQAPDAPVTSQTPVEDTASSGHVADSEAEPSTGEEGR